MDHLPQEACDTICESFQDTRDTTKKCPVSTSQTVDRAALATVSRKWQRAIERQNFLRISLTSNRSDLENLKTIVTGNRLRNVKFLDYTIILPSYSQEARGRFEREPDRQRNDEVFTEALRGLFEVLSSWGGTAFPISVQIVDIYSPMDFDHRVPGSTPGAHPKLSAISLADRIHEQIRNRDLHIHRYQYSFLNLLCPADLPLVPAIAGFTINDSHIGRQISPKAVAEIATRLPNMISLSLEIREPGDRFPAMRRANRDAVVSILKELCLPESVRTISVVMPYTAPQNQAWSPTNLIPSEEDCDPLCKSLRQLTVNHQRLQHLNIEGVIDASLLWPQTLDSSPKVGIIEPFWQNLETLHVKFNLTTPSGQWSFRGRNGTPRYPFQINTRALSDTQMPPGYGQTEEEDNAAALLFDTFEDQRQSGLSPQDNIFRVVPDEETLLPLVEAFARACAQIPRLREASLTTNLWDTVEFHRRKYPAETSWGIYYAAPAVGSPCHEAFSSRRDLNKRKLVFDVRDWKLPGEIYELFRDIGRERFGAKLIEKHVDTWDTIVKPRYLNELRQIMSTTSLL